VKLGKTGIGKKIQWNTFTLKRIKRV
jgi:hypothetical protein